MKEIPQEDFEALAAEERLVLCFLCSPLSGLPGHVVWSMECSFSKGIPQGDFEGLAQEEWRRVGVVSGSGVWGLLGACTFSVVVFPGL